MVRASVDIPNPFNNNEYKPIFLSSTEQTNIIKKNDLNKRLSEIEQHIKAVESLLNDANSVIVDDDNDTHSLQRSKSNISTMTGSQDMRYKIVELKRRLSNQKSLTDFKSEGPELSNFGKLRHQRSASFISERIERQSRLSSDHNDYIYSQSRLHEKNPVNISDSDLISLPNYQYEYTEKEQELKTNIDALRSRLIRKRISDTALSLKAFPTSSYALSGQSSRANSSLRLADDVASISSKKKRLSIIEDSYERLTSSDARNSKLGQSPGELKTGNADNRTARKSMSHGYLRYSQYTKTTSTVNSPQESQMNTSTNTQTHTRANTSTTSATSDTASQRKVLHMVRSIESMNGSLPSPTNTKLVDREKFAKLAESKTESEKRVASLRRRLTMENLNSQQSSLNKILSMKAAEEMDTKQNDVRNRIADLKRQVSKTKPDRASKTKSQILDGAEVTKSFRNSMNTRPLSRTSQYLMNRDSNVSDGSNNSESKESEETDKYSHIKETKVTDETDEEEEEEEEEENFADTTVVPKESNDMKSGIKETVKQEIQVTPKKAVEESDQKALRSAESHGRQSMYSSASSHHEYAYTKPDLESIGQNLTYRKSAFSNNGDQSSSKSKRNSKKITEDEDMNKIARLSGSEMRVDEDANEDEDNDNAMAKSIGDANEDSEEVEELGYKMNAINAAITSEHSIKFDERLISTQRNDETESLEEVGDLMPSEAIVFNSTTSTNNRLSVATSKKHGHSQSMTSNFSVIEKRAFETTEEEEDPLGKFLEFNQVFRDNKFDSEMNLSDGEEDTKKKVRSRRSFNVFDSKNDERPTRATAASGAHKRRSQSEVVTNRRVSKATKKSKQGFFRKLISVFKRKEGSR